MASKSYAMSFQYFAICSVSSVLVVVVPFIKVKVLGRIGESAFAETGELPCFQPPSKNGKAPATNSCSGVNGNSVAPASAAAPRQFPTDVYKPRSATLLFPRASIRGAYKSAAAAEGSLRRRPAYCAPPPEK